MRRRLWGLLVAVIALLPVTPARASVPVVVIDGFGWGHGVGMAQDGAYWMAKSGATTPQILGQFYPGANIGRATSAAVRVAVFTGTTATVGFPDGGRIDERGEGRTPGFPIRVDPGGRVRLSFANGRIVVDNFAGARASASATGSTTTTIARSEPPTPSPSPRQTALLPTTSSTTTTTPAGATTPGASSPNTPSSPSTTRTLALTPNDGGAINVIDRQRAYRGFVDVVPGATGFRMVNQLDIEQYLRGMGEVRDPSWPAAALRAQAIAARTYALRAMGAAGEICDGQRCQVYLGRQAEYGAMDKAVKDTAGEVLVYNRTLASAVYSANAGGFSASREEGFGTTGGGYPYLRPAKYETKNPMPWSITIALDDLAARLGREPITGVEVTSSGPSGRALTVALDGPTGRRTVSGLSLAAALGLRSTLFTTRLDVVDIAPPALTGGSVLQAAPDDVATGEDLVADEVAATSAFRTELPDRPSQTRAAIATSSHARRSALPPFGGLVVALAALTIVSGQWRPSTALAAIRRSWRAVRRPVGGRR